jgi:hypothetical protein
MVLKWVFLNGPNWMGGWAGIPDHDICAASTKTDSAMWNRAAEECNMLIFRLFHAWKIGWYVPMLFMSLIWGCYTVTMGVKYKFKQPKSTTVVIHKGSLKWVSPTKSPTTKIKNVS